MIRVAILLATVALWPGGQPGSIDSTDRHVILISIDGFAAFHLDNPNVDLPNIRALAAEGARASAETVFPSMTHPAHTTLITGTTPDIHGVVNNRVVDRRTGKRLHMTNLARAESIRVPTLFDTVHRAGRATAAFFWPETKDDAAIDVNFAEVLDTNEMADRRAISPALLSELRSAGIPIDTLFALYDDPLGQGAADLALTQAAVHVLRSRQPALLALHLLVADKVQHEFGAEHYLTAAALTTADHCVGLLRKALIEAGLAEKTTVLIAADHGFATVREELNSRRCSTTEPSQGRVRWIADGWYVWGELLPNFDTTRDRAAGRVLIEALR